MDVKTPFLSSNVALPHALLFFCCCRLVGCLVVLKRMKSCSRAARSRYFVVFLCYFSCYVAVVVFTVGVGSNVGGVISVCVCGVVYRVAGVQRSITRNTSIGGAEDGFSTIRRCCCRCRC